MSEKIKKFEVSPYPVAFTRVGETEISTVKLFDLGIRRVAYETCLFYGQGGSDVVQRYETEIDALRGHIRWIKKLLSEVK